MEQKTIADIDCKISRIMSGIEKIQREENEDRAALSTTEAISFVRERGIPMSKSKLYKLTAQKQIPFRKAGERLIFSTPVKEAVKEVTAGRGADVVMDVVGGAFTESALRATAWRGRVLVIGFAAGEIPRLPANLLLLKGCEASGVFWDELLRREPARAAEQVGRVLAGFADGSLRPRISARYPLSRGAEALQMLAGRKAPGKLLIAPAEA